MIVYFGSSADASPGVEDAPPGHGGSGEQGGAGQRSGSPAAAADQ
jgi:hypothetical protein